MIAIDKICYNSKLRYINAGEKFAFAVSTMLLCIISRSILVAGIVLIVTGILTVFAGGIPLFMYLRYLTVPLLFLVFSTAAIVINISSAPQDLFAVPAGTYYITGSCSSLMYALRLICTALSSVSCLYFLSFNTPMTDILNVLRKIHCPRLVIELMLLIYRYIFILLATASAISVAQNSRLANRNYKTRLRSFGTLVSVVFIRSIKRSGTLYDAMESRCYDGTLKVLNENYPVKIPEIIFIVLFEIILLMICFMTKRIYII